MYNSQRHILPFFILLIESSDTFLDVGGDTFEPFIQRVDLGYILYLTGQMGRIFINSWKEMGQMQLKIDPGVFKFLQPQIILLE